MLDTFRVPRFNLFWADEDTINNNGNCGLLAEVDNCLPPFLEMTGIDDFFTKDDWSW